MTETPIPRPQSAADPGHGILRGDHFQTAYATNDIERAKALFTRRYGIQHFRTLKGPLPEGGNIHVELAWAGGLMYEIMCAEGPGSDVYRSPLHSDGFQIAHHHLGYFIYDEHHWQGLLERVAREDWDMPLKRETPGFLASCMIWAPELGHFLEFIYPDQAGREFFQGVPEN